MKIKYVLFCFFLIIIFFSCNRIKTSEEVNTVLDKAGENRGELEKVIYHYSKVDADSLKLKAAFFLLKGMEDWYYYKGELLDKYLRYLDLINRDNGNGEYVLKSFLEFYGSFSTQKINKYSDIKTIKSHEMINNIDMAFKVWKEQPWGKDISFDQFCELILPFRIADEEPDYHREVIYKKYNWLLDSVRSVNGTAADACKVLNDHLKAFNEESVRDKWQFTLKLAALPHFPAEKLLKYRTGNCRDMADMALYVMRANGIPVALDFLPQWPYRNSGHNWNVVLNRDGKMVMFLGAEDSPGVPHKPGTKKAKIYRHTYAVNPESLAMIKDKNEIIPGLFSDPRIKDVTDEYVSCFDIAIPLKKQNTDKKIAYISVFNNNEWIPIHWSKVRKSAAVFTKMEGGILYLPVFFTKNNSINPAGFPFILDMSGKVKNIIPDTIHKTKLTLSERSPLIPDSYDLDALIGGKFQGSNDKNFSDAEDLYVFPYKPQPFINKINIKNDKSFKYLRYFSAPGKYCYIGKFTFYNGDKKIQGKSMNSPGISYVTCDTVLKEKSALGYYKSEFSSSGWVGLNLGGKNKVTSIKFSAKAELNNLSEGHTYDLSFWNNGNWESLQKQIVNKGKLVYNEVPGNALYRIVESGNKDGTRIFTYSNGKQEWW